MNNQSVSADWYTPAMYIEAARRVMGHIDLDPASCTLANETVGAASFYTKEENGLTLPWRGNVWLNPPFGRENGSGKSIIGMFVSKLIEEYEAGNIDQAIILLPVQTNAKWFWPLEDFTLCTSRKRVHFNRLVDGVLKKNSRDSHMLGTLFVYMGPHKDFFAEVFSQFGPVYRNIAPSPLEEKRA